MRRRDLEAALDLVLAHPNPNPDLEQYRTPSAIAAELLFIAHGEGAIADRRVLDLGCGTGMFAIGAALLGARMATGVDIDADAVALAQATALSKSVANHTWFVTANLADWHPQPGEFDTVIMNPPFGAQKGNKHADRLFIELAAEAVQPAGTVWFLALERTEGFLSQGAKSLGAEIDRVAAWDYPLVATMAHHTKEAQTVRVGGYKLSWPT